MSQIDRYKYADPGMSGVAVRHYAITPDDDNDLPRRPRALKCTASGTVVVRDEAGTDLSYTMTEGDELRFRPVRVLATGTTATVVGWE